MEPKEKIEIPALLYFSCWSLISITFLGLGFYTLDEEKPEASPLVIFVLKRFLALSVCHSSSYALVHRPAANISLLDHLKVSIFGFAFPLYRYIVLGFVPLKLIAGYAVLVISYVTLLIPEVDFGLSVDFIIRSLMFSLVVKGDKFFPVFVLVTAFFTSGIAAMGTGLSSETEDEAVKKYSKKRKFIKIAVYTLCGGVFAIFVRFTSFSSVVAFLCFSVAWLGCVALVMPRGGDFGIFDLLVCNVLIGCSNQFGMFGGPTLFAFAAASILFTLHPKVETVRLLRGQDVVILW